MEPESAVQLHSVSNWKRETRVVEIYAGPMGGPSMQGMP